MQPPDTAPALARDVVVPAVEALDLTLEVLTKAVDASTAPSLLFDPVQAVLLDCREGWTAAAGQALGLAQARSIPVLVLDSALDDTQCGLGDGDRRLYLEVNFDNMPSVAAATRVLRTALSDLLTVAQAGTVRSSTDDTLGARVGGRSLSPDAQTPSDAGSGVSDPAVSLISIDRTGAERLIAALYLDGLSDDAIREELLRRGAPRHWVASRLIRRSGW